ncbi:very short patch repair endonuclease [Chimaeribacter arupi]|uniref:very short patch repair endonuclease n=1 Tax=Chimaeribacter arupi TaxID=2060066 RepID=UPI000C7DE4DC|nr:DNA mismatch endonuclease Vsr [Chimaeribacter arupi]PLR50747.1 very short patch repair endonuclease [Chimaeribacter arupi]
MADVHSKEIRRKNMSAIRAKDTAPELWLRYRLHALGFRYRLHVKDMPGIPDILMPKYKCVIFVHGCFWHRHQCHLFHWPSTRPEWWREKLGKNYYRDLVVQDKLRESGWRVLTVWECAIKGKNKIDEMLLIKEVSEWIINGIPLKEIP